MLWLRLALKEIVNNYRFSLFFVLNLSIGLLGFIALDSFKSSIDQHLQNNSKAILTADVQISSRFPLTDQEYDMTQALLPGDFETSDQIAFLSMVAGNNNSRMTQLIGIDESYPQYGDIILQESGSVKQSEAHSALLSGAQIWVAEDLMLLLDLTIGDELAIGNQTFTVADVILEDPSSTISVMSSFPTVYMGLAQIESTGLIQTGSRITYSRFYRLEGDPSLDYLEAAFNARERELFRDTRRVSLTTHTEESEDLGEILNYLNDYLGLIAIIALFLAGVGAAYLFRSFFTSRFHDMAVLMCLGATPRQAYLTALLQIVCLGLVAAVIASFVAWLALPLLPMLFTGFLPRGFVNDMSLSSLSLALILGSVGSIACCLPILARIYQLNPSALFHEQVAPSLLEGKRYQQLLSYLPILLVFWTLAIWQSGSFRVGSLFILGFVSALLLLSVLAWYLLQLCGSCSRIRSVIPRIALRNLSRNRLGAISCFLAISLGALLINLIPQIQRGLQSEIATPEGFQVPDFFMFDIQEEQLFPLEAILEDFGYELSFLSPMVRARLEAVNGTSIDDVQETPDEQLMSRRMHNLTYQDRLKESEQLVAGEHFQGSWDMNSDVLPGISVEEGFAERMGFEIGDVLNFDVQSVPIEGRIVNLRSVSWNSFQPNFFISFQPGVLEPAPKTFVAAISQVSDNDMLPLQNAIVSDLPNISIINVTQIVARILDITDQISWAIRVMAWLSILAGLVVLFSIARYEVKSRFWEINLLKVLGAGFADVRRIIQIEFGILGFIAATAGVLLSLMLSWGISWFLFDSLWRFSWLTTSLSIVLISALSMVTALVATHSVLQQKPAELLRGE